MCICKRYVTVTQNNRIAQQYVIRLFQSAKGSSLHIDKIYQFFIQSIYYSVLVNPPDKNLVNSIYVHCKGITTIEHDCTSTALLQKQLLLLTQPKLKQRTAKITKLFQSRNSFKKCALFDFVSVKYSVLEIFISTPTRQLTQICFAQICFDP